MLTLDYVRLKHTSTSTWPPQISIIDPIFASNQICLKTLRHDKKKVMCQIKGERKPWFKLVQTLVFNMSKSGKRGRERSWNSKC
jgi:hypothetical protein